MIYQDCNGRTITDLLDMTTRVLDESVENAPCAQQKKPALLSGEHVTAPQKAGELK